MSVLVTGGAGYIGSHTVWRLSELGIKAVVIDNLANGDVSLLPPEAVFVQGDVSNTALVRQLVEDHEIRSVFHLAANKASPASGVSSSSYYQANVATTKDLLRAIAGTKVEQFIFSSSAGVYGEVDRHPVPESTKTHPLTDYGRSKAAGEELVRLASVEFGFNAAILRYFNVAGADRLLRAGDISWMAPTIVTAAVEVAAGVRPRVDVFGSDYPTRDGTCVRDFVHVCDIADAHVQALLHMRGARQNLLLNCGSGIGTSVRDIVQAVCKVSGRPIPFCLRERRSGDAAEVVADISKIRTVLGWRPIRSSLSEIIEDALRWQMSLARRGGAGLIGRSRDVHSRKRAKTYSVSSILRSRMPK